MRAGVERAVSDRPLVLGVLSFRLPQFVAFSVVTAVAMDGFEIGRSAAATAHKLSITQVMQSYPSTCKLAKYYFFTKVRVDRDSVQVIHSGTMYSVSESVLGIFAGIR